MSELRIVPLTLNTEQSKAKFVQCPIIAKIVQSVHLIFLKDWYASKWNSEYATEYSYFISRHTVWNVPVSNSSNGASLSLHNDPTDKFRFDDQPVLYRF